MPKAQILKEIVILFINLINKIIRSLKYQRADLRTATYQCLNLWSGKGNSL